MQTSMKCCYYSGGKCTWRRLHV